LPVYEELFSVLASRNIQWVQLDEPCLVLDLDFSVQRTYFKEPSRRRHAI
jgi:5-methyltetrahydropteroyltriglutamate--homocysteine methyltransferase